MIEIGKPPGELNGQHTLFPAHNFGSYLGFLAPHPKPCNGKWKYQPNQMPENKYFLDFYANGTVCNEIRKT